MQGSFIIDGFRIYEETRALRNFRFEVWDSSLNAGAGGWTSVITVASNPATPLTTYKTFAAVETTKVRLFITGHNSTDYIRLNELEVYGIPAMPLSNNNFEKNTFKLYPNPVNDGVLNIRGVEEVNSVEVYSILGNKMNVTFEKNKVFVNDLASGIYFIKINKNQSLKFIKN